MFLRGDAGGGTEREPGPEARVRRRDQEGTRRAGQEVISTWLNLIILLLYRCRRSIGTRTTAIKVQ